MKKLLIIVLIVLLFALSIFVVIQGVSIGSIEILGIKGIQAKNSELDNKIQEAGKLAEKDYKQAIDTIEANAKKLKDEKKNYEDMISISDEDDAQIANQIEKYELETIYVRIGNHATSQGVALQLDIVTGTSGAKDVYNLKFNVVGSYISITDFISAIENDSTLGFKIEEFKMLPSGSDLQATFVCKDIAIKDISSIATNTSNSENGGTQTNTDGTNNNENQTTQNNTTNNTSNATNTSN